MKNDVSRSQSMQPAKPVDPAVSEAARMMGRSKSPKKLAQALINGTGNKSRTGQTQSAESRAKISARLKASNAAKRAAKEAAAAEDAVAKESV